MLVAVPFGIFLTWKRGDLRETSRRLIVAAAIALGAGLIGVLIGGGNAKCILALMLGAWVIAASFWEVLWRARFPSASLAETVRRVLNLRRGQLGSTIAHIGLGVTIIGISTATAWNVEKLVVLKTSETVDLAGYQIKFNGVDQRQGPNYVALSGSFELRHGDSLIGTIKASKRKYDTPPTATTEAGIDPAHLGTCTSY